MKKAASKKVTPIDLGIKRTCPKCATKFYDFTKKVVECPKCQLKIDLESLATLKPPKRLPKPVKNIVKEDEAEEVVTVDTEFEPLEDLETDDDNAVEKIVDDDKEDEKEY